MQQAPQQFVVLAQVPTVNPQLQNLNWWNTLTSDVSKYTPEVADVAAAFDPKQASQIHAVAGATEAVANAAHLQNLNWWNTLTSDVSKYTPEVAKVADAFDPKQASTINAVAGAAETLSASQLQQLNWWNTLTSDVSKYTPEVAKVADAFDPKQASTINAVAGAAETLSASQLQNLGWWNSFTNDVHHVASDVSKYDPTVTRIAARVDPKNAKTIRAIGGGVEAAANVLKLQNLNWWSDFEHGAETVASDVAKYAPEAAKVAVAFDPKQASQINAVAGAAETVANASKLQQLAWWNTVASDVASVDPAVTNVAATFDPKNAGTIRAVGGGIEDVANALKMQNLGWWSNFEHGAENVAKIVAKDAPKVTRIMAAADPKQAKQIRAIGGATEAVANVAKLQILI